MRVVSRMGRSLLRCPLYTAVTGTLATRPPSLRSLIEHFRFDVVAARAQPHACGVPRRGRRRKPHCVSSTGTPTNCDNARLPMRFAWYREAGMPSRVEPPLANHHIGAGGSRGIQQTRRFVRQVLHVAVEQDHVRDVAAQEMGQAGAHRMSFAQVRGMGNDARAGRSRLDLPCRQSTRRRRPARARRTAARRGRHRRSSSLHCRRVSARPRSSSSRVSSSSARAAE